MPLSVIFRLQRGIIILSLSVMHCPNPRNVLEIFKSDHIFYKRNSMKAMLEISREYLPSFQFHKFRGQ